MDRKHIFQRFLVSCIIWGTWMPCLHHLPQEDMAHQVDHSYQLYPTCHIHGSNGGRERAWLSILICRGRIVLLMLLPTNLYVINRLGTADCKSSSSSDKVEDVRADEISEKDGAPGLSHWIESLRVAIDEKEKGEEVDADIKHVIIQVNTCWCCDWWW